ncbi:MAG TPA: ImmA/IrrE family metallo-endopeptidase [Kofleriaceae bacterium]|jgi:hypothetical protein
MGKLDGIRAARQGARGVLHRFGVQAPEHIAIEAFARAFGATLVEAPLDGAQAQLIRTADKTEIMLAERVADPAARRFSIAHELGHLVLQHPSRPPSELCGQKPVPRAPKRATPDVAPRDYEAEANAFAAELLLPEALLRRACEVSPVSLAIPRAIAAQYQVSLLAAAIRFCELASERCAAVFSAAGAVRWCAPSATFARDIPRGKKLDPQSLAHDFFRGRELPDAPEPVPADAWFDTSRDGDLIEHSTGARDLGTVLSLLWVPEDVGYLCEIADE